MLIFRQPMSQDKIFVPVVQKQSSSVFNYWAGQPGLVLSRRSPPLWTEVAILSKPQNRDGSESQLFNFAVSGDQFLLRAGLETKQSLS